MSVGVEEARWRELRARLGAFVGWRVGNPEDAEDIVQDVFVRMQRGIVGLSSTERLDAWAFKIARNAIADHYRSPKRRSGDEGEGARASEVPVVDPAGDGPPADARTEMARCISPMAERSRTITDGP